MKKIYYYPLIKLSLLVYILLSSPFVHANNHLNRAINACAGGLQMPTINTGVSFKTLQRYLQKYQVYRQVALLENGQLKQSKILYKGSYFNDKPYYLIQQQCEQKLSNKVAAAIAHLSTEQDRNEREQQYLQAHQLKQQKLAQQQAELAFSHCQIYINKLPNTQLDTDQLAKDFKIYRDASQQALRTDTNILQLTASYHIKDKKQLLNFSQWFEYCAHIFAKHQATVMTTNNTAETTETTETAETAETAETTETAETAETKPTQVDIKKTKIGLASLFRQRQKSNAANNTDTVKTDQLDIETAYNDPEEIIIDEDIYIDSNEDFDPFDTLLATAEGDRQRILSEEEIEPSFSSKDSDDILATKTWYYDDDNSCRIYQFQINKLLHKKTLETACP